VELMKGLLEEKEIENCSVRRQLSQVGFEASGFGFRGWDFWFFGSGFGFRCSGLWASGVWFRISGLGIGLRSPQITEDAIGIINNSRHFRHQNLCPGSRRYRDVPARAVESTKEAGVERSLPLIASIHLALRSVLSSFGGLQRLSTVAACLEGTTHLHAQRPPQLLRR
jgi:hypothetical protein